MAYYYYDYCDNVSWSSLYLWLVLSPPHSPWLNDYVSVHLDGEFNTTMTISRMPRMSWLWLTLSSPCHICRDYDYDYHNPSSRVCVGLGFLTLSHLSRGMHANTWTVDGWTTAEHNTTQHNPAYNTQHTALTTETPEHNAGLFVS
jgi:hypothetical protein